MSTVTVTAITDFLYGDQAVVRGARVEMRPIDAVLLARQQKVSLTRGYQARVLEADPVNRPDRTDLPPAIDGGDVPMLAQTEFSLPAEVEPTPKRRRYRRRDLTAETS